MNLSMSSLMQDVRFAVRQMVKRPGFTGIVVLTMALGIGANAAIFSVLNAVLLRPLPYSNPEKLVKVWSRFRGIGMPNDQNFVSIPEFHNYQQLNNSFSDMAAIRTGFSNLGEKGAAQRVVGTATVSPNLFGALGVQTMMGRTFLPEEGQPGRDHEVVLSYALWKEAFGGNPRVIGTTIDIDGAPHEILGVMPNGFAYPAETDLWTPLAFTANDLSESSRGNHALEVLGRIKPGLSMTQVQEDMDRVARRMMEQSSSYPYQRFGFGVILHPLLEETVGDVKPVLLVLMAAVGLVLLIACANVANLLLSRATERQQEMETRMALGASGERLARQLLTESIALALAGGAVGLAITPFIVRGLLALVATALPRAVHTGVDLWVLGLTVVVSVATGILFGLAPALQVRGKLHFDAVKAGKNTEGRRPKQLRNGLVIFETALSLVLVAGAGLLLRSFAQILKVDPGFRPEGVLTLHVALREAVYSKPEQVRGFYDTLLNRIQGLPGVEAAGAVNVLPLSGKNSSGTITVDTQAVPQEKTSPEADGRVATPGYFKAMGIALVRGRTFEAADAEGGAPVAIVDESLAQTYWPKDDPIGRRLHTGGRGSNDSWLTVVGVVRHVRNRTLETRSRVEVYLPQDQAPQSGMTLAIRTSAAPMSLAPTVEREISTIDPTLPIYHVQTMAEVMGDSLQRRRLALELLGVFAELALLLALIGIYGVTSYAVNQRQVEIGLRMALGADRWQVLGMMVRNGMGTIAIGLGVGLVLALGLTQLIRGMLFDVRAWDPLALSGATLLLVLMALIAILIPARRATKVDPMTALRHE